MYSLTNKYQVITRTHVITPQGTANSSGAFLYSPTIISVEVIIILTLVVFISFSLLIILLVV